MRGRKGLMIYGIVLIFASYVVLLFALYLLDPEDRAPARMNKESGSGMSVSIEPRRDVAVRRTPEADLGQPAEALRTIPPVRSPEKMSRPPKKEEVFWIDRKLSQCLVMLGTVDGLKDGAIIDIYDGRTKVGEAKVVQALDTMSYAEPVGKTQDDFAEDYYKAVP